MKREVRRGEVGGGVLETVRGLKMRKRGTLCSDGDKMGEDYVDDSHEVFGNDPICAENDEPIRKLYGCVRAYT